MCCILACFSARPSLAVLSNIAASNRDGLGVMWIDRKTGTTRWRKGLQTAAEVFEITETLPLPFAVHARWATAGGATGPLTHPFPIPAKGEKPSLALSGSTTGAVLMHNGHLNGWEEIAARLGFKLPENPRGWSDTRVIAALVAKRGRRVLKTLGQKFATLSVARGLEIVGSFTEVAGEPGVFASSYCGPAHVWPPFDIEAYRDRLRAEAQAAEDRANEMWQHRARQAARMRNDFDERYGSALDNDDDVYARIQARLAAIPDKVRR